MLAEEVGSCLPAAKLAAVTQHPDSGKIYGVVYRRSLDETNADTVKSWILRLSETPEGNFYWDDFVPCCPSCGKLLTPLAEQKQCPVCKGKKGKGQCFHFDCSSGSFRIGCNNLRPENLQTYCGSHPLFGGYALPDQHVGDEGVPLWKEELDADEPYKVSIVADGIFGESVVVLPGRRELSQDQGNARVYSLEPGGPSIFAEWASQRAGPFECATTLRMRNKPWPGDKLFLMFLHSHEFMWVQKSSGQMAIWLPEPGCSASISEAVVDCPRECLQFRTNIVSLGNDGLVAMSRSGLWAMDFPADLDSWTVEEVATKVSWRKVMDLPPENGIQEKAGEEDGSDPAEDVDEIPKRYLAPGPKENQVMIFKTEGLHIKPWLLVELAGEPWGAESRITKVTSTASVLWQRNEVLFEQSCRGPASEYCSLLPSVFRLKQRHAGYLFFDERGRIQLLRDEEILREEDAWIAPNFAADPAQRVITFKFPSEGGVGRSCLSSVLMRYEYFQKALEGWREGSSSEVVVPDATTQSFELLIAYFHTGTIGDLGLESLVGLLELGNKYLLPHLMSLCMSKILRLLTRRGFIEDQKPSVMADLVIVANKASACGPFKTKVVDFVVSLRPDLTHDAAFLSRISAESVDLLAQMMSSLLPRGNPTPAKRRKIQDDRQKALWDGRDREVPKWSATSVREAPALP